MILGLMIFSCSDSSPQIISLQPIVVLDYKNYDSFPKSKLSIFMMTGSSPQRAASIEIKKPDSSLTWIDSNPEMFSFDGANYVCSENITPPYGTSIQNGNYTINYADLAGEEMNISFSINYDHRFLSSNATHVISLLEYYTENLALYDEGENLIYYGKIKDAWKTDNDILREFKNAFVKRRCLVTQNNSVLILMPKSNIGEK